MISSNNLIVVFESFDAIVRCEMRKIDIRILCENVIRVRVEKPTRRKIEIRKSGLITGFFNINFSNQS